MEIPFRILSWDIGIRNLSYCVVETSYSPLKNQNKIEYKPCKLETKSLKTNYIIKNWGTLDLINTKPIPVHYCSAHNKNKKKCTKRAKYIYKEKGQDDIYLCGTHCKKYDEKKLKKVVKKRRKRVKTYKINDLSRPLYEKLIELDNQNVFNKIDTVIFENQPAFKNPTMKSIQMLLYGYFQCKLNVERKLCVNLVNQSPKHKLDAYTGPKDIIKVSHIKDKYARRKKQAIAYTQEMTKIFPIWNNYFLTNKKKDDLSDSFLQAIYYLNKRKKSYIILENA